MRQVLTVMTAAGIGAGAMYLLDPVCGKRRRNLLRNKAKHFNRIAVDAAGKTQRDVRNHLVGAVSRVESLFHEHSVTDDVLEARVRSKLGRVVSHPHAIQVKAVEGLVILTGPILSAEVHPLIERITHIEGVKNIQNDLEIHEDAGDIPALQGGKPRRGEQFGPFKSTWSPTMRLVAGVTGGALAIYGGKRRDILGSAVGSLGLGMVTRALTNIEAQRLFGMGSGAPETDVNKPVAVPAEAQSAVM